MPWHIKMSKERTENEGTKERELEATTFGIEPRRRRRRRRRENFPPSTCPIDGRVGSNQYDHHSLWTHIHTCMHGPILPPLLFVQKVSHGAQGADNERPEEEETNGGVGNDFLNTNSFRSKEFVFFNCESGKKLPMCHWFIMIINSGQKSLFEE
jgi:hypothetical protein